MIGMRRSRLVVLAMLVATAHTTTNEPRPQQEGSIVFTDSLSKRLLRLDGADGSSVPRVIARDIATYGGLIPWKGMLLAATRNYNVVQIDPWCNSSCESSVVVDVLKALGVEKVVDVFAIGDLALCGDDALFVSYGGNATTGHSGVLRCEGCEKDIDCTSKCAVVDGSDSPGAGMHQLGGYAAGVECVGDEVLVVDNTNFRVQAIPASCSRSPCKISTFASKLKYPLGIAKVSDAVLVTLDSTIASLSLDGSQHLWSMQGDCGYLVQAENRVIVSDGNILSFDPSCRGPDCKPSVVWNATGGIKVYGAVAHITPG